MKHKLKTYQEHLDNIRLGVKPYEIRRNDRDFKVGDILWLKGWNPTREEYTGDELKVDVLSVLENVPEFGLAAGFCIMGIKIRPKLPTVEEKKEYVEDISCLDEFPGLEIDKVIHHHNGITIEWGGWKGYWGQLTIGADENDKPVMDTENMGGNFVRALLTLYFLDANPKWDVRKTIDNNETI